MSESDSIEGADFEEEVELDAETLEAPEEIEVDVGELDESFGANLALQISDNLCDDIGQRSQEILTNLKNSRTEWEEKIKLSIKLLGVSTDQEANTPTENSCTAVVPLIMENVVKFQAKAIQELWPAKGPVRTKLKASASPEALQAATRVRAHMNYQLTEEVPGFYNALERNLFRVALMGTGIRKVAWNNLNNSPDPATVPIERFYVDPGCTHLRHAEDYIEEIEITGREMQQYVASGKFKDCGDEDAEEQLDGNEIGEAIMRAQGFDVSLDRKGFLIGERHGYLDLEGADDRLPEGGYAPYIVHFNVKSGKVYAIRRNWQERDPALTKRLWYTVDQFIPAFGFYAFGFAHLIGDIAASSSATLRALVDSGQYANWQAGFKSKDAKFSDTDSPLAFGEFRDVDLAPEELQRAFLPLPAKEPSQVLFALLQYMVSLGQKFADATDEVVNGATNYGPVATTLALLEASQRFYSSIHKRLHQSQHEFFQLLRELYYENLPDRTKFTAEGETSVIFRTDYAPDLVDVLPASDPNALSETQRIAKAQIELETAQRFPQHHDIREALRRFYVAVGSESIDKLMPDAAGRAISADPLSELQAAMKGQPIAAKMGQNHQAHIAVKEAFMKSPQMQGTNDPSVAMGMEILKSNIAEHKVLMFIAQVMQMAQQNGVPVQDENVQATIANQLVAMSAAQAGGNGMSVEQQMIELNKQELEVAKMRLMSQDSRENAKLAMKQQEIELKRMQLLGDLNEKQARLEVDSASKTLDFMAKQADTAREILNERVQNAAG